MSASAHPPARGIGNDARMATLRLLAQPIAADLTDLSPSDAIALVSYLGGAKLVRFPPQDRPRVARSLGAALAAAVDADALDAPQGTA